MAMSFSFSDYGLYIPGNRDLVATGTTQNDALPITAKANIFTTVAAGTGAVLPTNTASHVLEIIVMNRGDHSVLIYPPPRGQIDALGMNIPAAVVSGGATTFMCFDSPMAPGIQWWTR